MSQSSTHGNTLAEYGLIGLLLLSVCVAAISQLGFNLNGQLDNFQHSLAYKPKAAVGAGGNGANGGNGKPMLEQSANAEAQAKALMNATGTWTSPLETAERIRVAGANGTTREMLGNFEKWIQQMRDAGEIDDVQANQLQKMANDGHYLADAEKSLEDAIFQGKNNFSFSGKVYSAAEMAEAIGLNPSEGANSWDLDPAYSKPIIAPLANSYQQAKQDGTLSNPVVKQKVSELIIQIAAASDALSWNADVALNSGTNMQGAQFNQTTANYFQQNLYGAVVKIPSKPTSASGLTNSNSGKICQIGSSKDSGSQCN